MPQSCLLKSPFVREHHLMYVVLKRKKATARKQRRRDTTTEVDTQIIHITPHRSTQRVRHGISAAFRV